MTEKIVTSVDSIGNDIIDDIIITEVFQLSIFHEERQSNIRIARGEDRIWSQAAGLLRWAGNKLLANTRGPMVL